MTGLGRGERARIDELANLLIPRGSRMPSGSEAEVASIYIDKVFDVRPDLVDVVRDGMQELPERFPSSFEELQTHAPPSLRAVADAITAAYFLNPEVSRLVGYRKRSEIPIQFDEDLDELVSNVVARGTIYRPTPAAKER